MVEHHSLRQKKGKASMVHSPFCLSLALNKRSVSWIWSCISLGGVMTFIGYLCMSKWRSAPYQWLHCYWNGDEGLEFIQPWLDYHKKGNNFCRRADRVRTSSCCRQQSTANSQHSFFLIKAIKNIWNIFFVKGQLGGIYLESLKLAP